MGFRNKLLKFWNFWPPFLFTGIKIVEVTPDYSYLKAKLKLRFWNANYVGTQYGGSIFSLADPFYMVMLLKNLGKGYIVWDKSATIRYLKPGKSDLTAEFKVSSEQIASIQKEVDTKGKMEWIRTIEIIDKDSLVVAEVEKVIHIRKAKAKD